MTLIDEGEGVPVIVIPGIQGRWQWHAPAIRAMVRRCRVVTFSFADEKGVEARFDSKACIDSYCDQILAAMTQTGLTKATLCGISYGGLVAAVFTARHPERVSSLILASALPPTWKPDERARPYLRAPRLMTPVFMMASLRMFGEILIASPHPVAAVGTSIRHGWNVLTHMFSPTRMARRALQLSTLDLTPEVANVTVPTLVIVGEEDLDRVVPVASTLIYTRLLPHAQVVTLARTGHLGSVTRPEMFAELVVPFAERYATFIDPRRRLG